jgi:hypothetical protein
MLGSFEDSITCFLTLYMYTCRGRIGLRLQTEWVLLLNYYEVIATTMQCKVLYDLQGGILLLRLVFGESSQNTRCRLVGIGVGVAVAVVVVVVVVNEFSHITRQGSARGVSHTRQGSACGVSPLSLSRSLYLSMYVSINIYKKFSLAVSPLSLSLSLSFSLSLSLSVCINVCKSFSMYIQYICRSLQQTEQILWRPECYMSPC